MIAYAFFIRTQGLLLLASYGIVEFFQLLNHRTDREIVKKTIWSFLYICVSFGSLWLIYGLVFPGGGESYFDQYKDFQMQRVLGYASGYSHVFSEFFGKAEFWNYLYYGLFIFFLIGLWIRRKEETIFIVFSVVWMLLLLTWPSWQGPRFIFPLLPIYIYFIFQGIKFVIQKIPATNQIWGQRAFIVFWVAIIGVFVFQSGTSAYTNLSRHRNAADAYDRYSLDMYEFIRENTPPQSIIVFFKPRAMRMFTDRDSYVGRTCEELTRGTYVVINKLAENSQVSPNEVNECGIPMQEVFENRRFIVYEIPK